MTAVAARDSLTQRLDDIIVETTRKPYPSERRREAIRAWIDDLLSEATVVRAETAREKVTVG